MKDSVSRRRKRTAASSKRNWTGWCRRARDRWGCPPPPPIPKDAVNESKALGRLKGQDVCDVVPSYPTALRPCRLAFAALPVTQVSVERLFSAMRLFLSDLRSRLKQDAVEATLLLNTNKI